MEGSLRFDRVTVSVGFEAGRSALSLRPEHSAFSYASNYQKLEGNHLKKFEALILLFKNVER